MNAEMKHHEQADLKVIALFLAFIGLFVITVVVVINDYLAVSRENRQWTQERITWALGISIPEDASNVHLDGERDSYVHYFILDFDASPSTLASFASHFCNGVLHSGYDPFNDIEVARSVDSPYAVMIEYIYNYQVPPVVTRFYAYSPITSEDIFGNECYSFDETGDISGSVELIVDKSNVGNHQIHLEYYGHSYAYPRWVDAMEVQPFENFPLLLRGLSLFSSGRYFKDSGMLCIEIDPLIYLLENENWNWLVGSNIQIAIDGNNLPEAYISAQGLLTPRHDQEGAIFLENDRYFNYCYAEAWSEGEHELQIEVRGTSRQHYALTWNFDTH